MHRVRTIAMAFAAMLLGLAAMSAPAFAAEGTPASSPGAGAAALPVAIHQGTCAEPVAEPAWKVNDASPITSSDTVGGAADMTVSESSGKVKAKLDDLGHEPYVIAVHASAADYDTIVACGMIAGPKVDGKLVVALTPVNDSGVTGVAVFDEDKSGVLDLGSDEVQITVYLIGAGGSMATPAS